LLNVAAYGRQDDTSSHFIRIKKSLQGNLGNKNQQDRNHRIHN
jgi:hypothetical protein